MIAYYIKAIQITSEKLANEKGALFNLKGDGWLLRSYVNVKPKAFSQTFKPTELNF